MWCPEFGYGTAKVGSAPAALGSAPAAPAAARLDRERRRRRRVLRTRTRTRTSGRGSALSPSVAGAAVAERPPPPPRNQRHGAVGDGKRRVPAPWRHVRRWRPGLSPASPVVPAAVAAVVAGGGGCHETAGAMCHDARRGRPQRRRRWPPHATAQVRKRVGAAARRIAAVATVFCLNEILTLRQICEKSSALNTVCFGGVSRVSARLCSF